jgi:transcription elongation factor Elf1
MTQEELKMELEELAVRFSEGWHEGIKIDASDIMLLNEAAEALAQPEQEPVELPCCGYTDASAIKWNSFNGVVQCHNCGQTYTPPQRKPLTNGEIYTAYITATNQTLRAQDERLAFEFARAIEAAHGIKENT